MGAERKDVSSRLGHILIFVVLAIVTLGLYPFYFWVSRVEERNALLGEILAELKSNRMGRGHTMDGLKF